MYYGDNLPVIREHLRDESVDLIYLDPPFNSNASYNVLFREKSGEDSPAQIEAFTDTWQWTQETERTYELDIIQNPATPSNVVEMVAALRQFVGSNAMTAYLVMMAPRLIELHRVLKPTGSIYLHCDPTAVHYLRLLMDATFGKENFRNEIVWKRTTAHSDARRFGRNIDTILFYTKSDSWTWNQLYLPFDEEYKKRFRNSNPDGRAWADDNLTAKGLSGGGYEYEYKGAESLWRVPLETMKKLDCEGRLHFTSTGGIRLKRYLDELKGRPIQALWDDINPINSQAKERLGYPTQKPQALLERIIQASSNPGDVVFDPFCGCGTAVAAAHKLGRRWLGIDITHLAVALMKSRLKTGFKLLPDDHYRVIGEPQDVGSARALWRQDPFQFQYWAVSLLEAVPRERARRGPDQGIDGIIYFIDGPRRKPEKVIIQVKGGKVSSPQIRDLVGVVEREKAAIGLFISLEKPTRAMTEEAAKGGFYFSHIWDRHYPKIQIRTIEQMLKGPPFELPPVPSAYKPAEWKSQNANDQLMLMESPAPYDHAELRRPS